jgi:hypothetical protein
MILKKHSWNALQWGEKVGRRQSGGRRLDRSERKIGAFCDIQQGMVAVR